MNIKKIKFAVPLVVAIALIWAFQRPSRQAMEVTETDEMEGMSGMEPMAMLTSQKRELIGVKIEPVYEQDVEKIIRTSGRVAYNEQKLAHINLKVEGWIQDLFVNFTGQDVKAGEPLFTLYSPDLLSTQQEYLLALRSQEKFSKSSIADLRETGDTLVASAKRRLLLWGITEQQIQALVKRGRPQEAMTIYSPITGVVTKREGVRGMRITPGMTLYEIADISTVWVIADVYEYELDLIRKGDEATITVAAYPGETFRGRVAFIDPFLNPQTRTVRVRMEFPNPDFKLKPEMFAQVTLKSSLGKGLLIPEAAVLDSGLRQIVFVDKGMNMYLPKEIHARRLDGHYMVIKGLNSGEQVVTSANFLIDAESKLMASSNMMGALGMGGVKMEQAKMGEMDMQGMKGMGKKDAPTGPQTKKLGNLTLTLFTEPTPPQEGENLLRLKITDASGKPVENAQVTFAYTMPMPGMKTAKRPSLLKDGHYEAKVNLGMAGTWEVTSFISQPGKPEVQATFMLDVGGEMGEM